MRIRADIPMWSFNCAASRPLTDECAAADNSGRASALSARNLRKERVATGVDK